MSLRWYAFLCGFGSDVLFTIDHLRSISFFSQNAHHDWLTKEYISNWFLVTVFYKRYDAQSLEVVISLHRHISRFLFLSGYFKGGSWFMLSKSNCYTLGWITDLSFLRQKHISSAIKDLLIYSNIYIICRFQLMYFTWFVENKVPCRYIMWFTDLKNEEKLNKM